MLPNRETRLELVTAACKKRTKSAMSDPSSKRSRGSSARSSQSRVSGVNASVAGQLSNELLGQGQSSTLPMRDEQQQQRPPPGKMALPPLPRAAGISTTSKLERNRTSHACDACRKSKSKCTGQLPCERCKAERKRCNYGDGKRDLERREHQRLIDNSNTMSMWNRKLVETMANLIRNPDSFKDSLNETQGILDQAIAAQLASRGSGVRESDLVQLAASHGQSGRPSSQEDAGDADAGSTGSLDVVNEDPDRHEAARATGFLGKSSAVAWVQRAKGVIESDQDSTSDLSPEDQENSNSYMKSTYLAEERDLPRVTMNDRIHPFDWPSADTIAHLVGAYWTTVHPSFLVLDRARFMADLQKFDVSTLSEYSETGEWRWSKSLSQEQQNWMSMANIVFAISARFAHLVGPDWSGSDNDHRIYMARARALGMETRILGSDPSIMQTTILALYGLYLITTDELSKAWIVVGTAIRHAFALGLHVKNQSPTLSDARKEGRVRLWWSIFQLEITLNQVQGRPSGVQACFVSVKLPLCLDDSALHDDNKLYSATEESGSSAGSGSSRPLERTPLQTSVSGQSSSGAAAALPSTPSYEGRPLASFAFSFSLETMPTKPSTFFVLHTQLSIISHAIMNSLYSPPLADARWSDIQRTIGALDQRLEEWKRNVPEDFEFSRFDGTTQPHRKVKGALKLHYSSCRMLLFRPCLCRFEGRIKSESDQSKTFNAQSSSKCIDAARSVAEVLPVTGGVKALYDYLPWWHIVHYLVEAAAICVLEIAYRAEHVPSQAEGILQESKQILRWLSALSKQSVSARKAWEALSNVLAVVAPKVGGTTDDLEPNAPKPPHYQGRRPDIEAIAASRAPSRPSINTRQSQVSGWQHGCTDLPDASPMNPTANFVPRYTAPPPASGGHNEVGASFPAFNQSYMQDFIASNRSYGIHDQFGPMHAGFDPQSNFFTSPHDTIGMGTFDMPASNIENFNIMDSINSRGSGDATGYGMSEELPNNYIGYNMHGAPSMSGTMPQWPPFGGGSQ